MVILFSVTLFVGSALLFLVEPMFAKMALPLLGGAPAVWNTCMLFFQTALLGGYAYAHLATSKLSARTQVPIHLVLILLPLAFLPVAISPGWNPPREANPIPWLLLLMTCTVGLPFFAVSTSASVMQKWFSMSEHSQAHDPYFLYASSNVGSLVGLIGYIVLVEPRFTLAEQGRIWQIGYILLILLIAACAGMVWKGGKTAAEMQEPDTTEQDRAAERITPGRRLRWVALAFAPSSLMLGLTSYYSTDIAAVPLLWVVPLTIYLLTFVLAFSRRTLIKHYIIVGAFFILVLAKLLSQAQVAFPGLWASALLNVSVFAFAAWACHGELAEDRPSAGRLTEFYLLVAVGGALGGAFNALIAPVIFSSVIEYPLVLVAAAALMRWHRPSGPVPDATPNIRDIALPFALGAAVWIAMSFARTGQLISPARGIQMSAVAAGLVCLTFLRRPLRYGLSLAAMLAVLTIMFSPATLYQERNFFGVIRVFEDSTRSIRLLKHGTTLHGAQNFSDEHRREPLTYYYRTGPIGQVFQNWVVGGKGSNIAVIGLGAGSLAGYAESDQALTFYEIDPAVKKIAEDPQYFTFLQDAASRGATIRVVVGDGRLAIERGPDNSYDLIVLDAFSSDSIPLHLLTRQALQVYLSKLRDHGLIALHLSNRWFDLEPVVGNLAADSQLSGLHEVDVEVSPEERYMGKEPSRWALLARGEEDFRELRNDSRWMPIRTSYARVWTDDYSNILAVLK